MSSHAEGAEFHQQDLVPHSTSFMTQVQCPLSKALFQERRHEWNRYYRGQIVYYSPRNKTFKNLTYNENSATG